MSKPPFTMSKYMNMTDLLEDKAKFYQEKSEELEKEVEELKAQSIIDNDKLFELVLEVDALEVELREAHGKLGQIDRWSR
jgi:hypothetical protein